MTNRVEYALIISSMAKTKKKTTAQSKRTPKRKPVRLAGISLPRRVSKQSDLNYFAKILVFFILGTFWVRLLHINIGPFEHFSVPAGFAIGLVIASHERLQIDRKIEYVVLISATFISFYLPVGVTI